MVAWLEAAERMTGGWGPGPPPPSTVSELVGHLAGPARLDRVAPPRSGPVVETLVVGSRPAAGRRVIQTDRTGAERRTTDGLPLPDRCSSNRRPPSWTVLEAAARRRHRLLRGPHHLSPLFSIMRMISQCVIVLG